MIRQVLRRAGFRDFDDRHLDGFAVEGASGDDDDPFSVAYCGDTNRPAELSRYRRAIERAGLIVTTDPDDEDGLLVQRRSVRHVEKVARPALTVLSAAVVCAVLATVALVVSWTADGTARLAGGIGSAVLSVAAALLAVSWYRRQLDERDA